MWTNSITTTLILIIIGLGSGAAIAAGVFALLTKIGVLTQIAHRTKTSNYVTVYETTVLLGGLAGTLLTIFHFFTSHALARRDFFIHTHYGHFLTTFLRNMRLPHSFLLIPSS